MGDAILADDRPVARKHHFCNHCQCSIAPGQKYRRTRAVQDGSPYVWKSHLDCEALAMMLWRESSMCWDEYPVLHEEDRRDLAEWRGEFPHVVCRVELGWHLARQRMERRDG